MDIENFVSDARKLSKRYRVDNGSGFNLKKFDPSDTADFAPDAKREAKDLLAKGVDVLATLQDMLYAQDKWAVLLIFQAMDAAGKDSAIKHVMSGINPQGCQVFSFKAPTSDDLDHDYLWRCVKCLPERGRIGIFNRSYYEETLVVRVHPNILEAQKLPPALLTKHIWEQRFEDITAFERYLSRNGVLIRKFFLNVSKEEQKKRFLARIEQPEKNWKFSSTDVAERKHWDAYMEAYQDAIRNTATPEAPWYVVPADHKWFTRLVVAGAVIDALASLNLAYPKLDKEKLEQLRQSRAELSAE